MKLYIFDQNKQVYNWWNNFSTKVFDTAIETDWYTIKQIRTDLLKEYGAVLHDDDGYVINSNLEFESEEMASLFFLTFS